MLVHCIGLESGSSFEFVSLELKYYSYPFFSSYLFLVHIIIGGENTNGMLLRMTIVIRGNTLTELNSISWRYSVMGIRKYTFPLWVKSEGQETNMQRILKSREYNV